MKKILTALICLLPSKLAIVFLKIVGHKVNWDNRIGFSLIFVDNLKLDSKTKIGHFNYINIDCISFREKAYIGSFNLIKGPIILDFDKTGAIGNFNTVSRAVLGVTYGKAVLKLGELAKITSRHFIDLTKNVTLGDFSTLAGAGSQIWTHGYIHAKEGASRIRVDGDVYISNNVYLGSNCVINAGVKINEAITVGSNSTVSKDLIESGMYVGQKLRYIEKTIDDVKSSLRKVEEPNLIESVYQK